MKSTSSARDKSISFIYCNISSMEVLYAVCFRIILLSFRKPTLTRIILVLVQGTCGSDSIYGWNLRVEKFHLCFRILPAFVGHKGKLFVTVRVFLLSLRQSNTDKKLSLTIVNNVVYFCQYLKKKSIFQFNLSILNIDFCEVYVICRAAQRTDNNFRKRN